MQRYEKYKDSGIFWLSEVPEHWKVESFKNILKERNEKNNPIKSKEILSLSIGKGVTLYAEKTTNLDRFKDDFSQYKLAYEGDLVLNSMNMIVGAVGVSEYFGCVSPVYYTFYGGTNNFKTSKFYEYLFRCKTVQGVLYSLGKGLMAIDRGEGKYNTLRLKVSRDDLRSLKLPHPSLSEQTEIVNFLNDKTAKIDQTIANKQKEIELLKERRQIIIQKAVTKGLDDTMPLKDSGVDWIGEIPEHWEVSKLKYVLTMRNEKIESKSTDKVYVGMENIESQTGRYLQTDSQVEGLANIFYKNDILFGKLRPYLAKVYLSKFDGICSTEFLVYKSANASYYQRVLLSDIFIKLVDSSTYGAKMPRASADFINNISIPTPPEQEQTQIVSYLEEIEEKIAKAILLKQQEIEKLKEYKTVLIDNVVTGKVRVS